MKKVGLLSILILFSSLFLVSRSHFHVALSGNYWIPLDDDYQTIYGESMVYPELKLGMNIYHGLYIWLDYGYLKAEGTIPVVDEPASSDQHHVSAGAGYEFSITKFLTFRIEAGSYNVYYMEKTQFSEETGIAFGFRGNAGLFFYLKKNIFLGLSAGYLRAAKTVNSNSVTFGGMMTGLAIGLCF